MKIGAVYHMLPWKPIELKLKIKSFPYKNKQLNVYTDVTWQQRCVKF